MMMRLVSVLAMLVFLAACGGGGGGPVQQQFVQPETPNETPSVPTQTPDEEESASAPDEASADEPGQLPEVEGDTPPELEDPVPSKLEETLAFSDEDTIALTGIAIVTDSDTGQRVILTRDGSYIVADQTQTLADMPFILTTDVPGAFLNASSFVQNADGAFGVVGIATLPENMPIDGSATFNGGAAGFVIVGDTGIDLSNGTSTVIVEFEDGSVSAEMGDFQVTSQLTGDLRDGLFDSMTLSGATLAGAGFTGGVLETSGGDSVDDIIGGNARLLSQGQFFGTDIETGLPAEVGGLVLTEGDDGKIFGTFIAN